MLGLSSTIGQAAGVSHSNTNPQASCSFSPGGKVPRRTGPLSNAVLAQVKWMIVVVGVSGEDGQGDPEG